MNPKSFLFSRIKWSGDGETWKTVHSSVVKDGRLEFALHGSEKTRLKGNYTPSDGIISLYPSDSKIWIGEGREGRGEARGRETQRSGQTQKGWKRRRGGGDEMGEERKGER